MELPHGVVTTCYSYSFNTSCSTRYICIAESKYCNDLAGGHQPGLDNDIDGVIAWRSG